MESEEPVDAWLAVNRPRLEALADTLVAPQEAEGARLDHFKALVEATVSLEDDLEPRERAAAALLGRGGSPAEIDALVGISPADLAVLSTDQRFALRVEEYREGWALEQVGRVQRYIDDVEMTDVYTATTAIRLLLELLTRREKRIAQRLDLAQKRLELLEHTRELSRPERMSPRVIERPREAEILELSAPED